jgi:hypothetical protein
MDSTPRQLEVVLARRLPTSPAAERTRLGIVMLSPGVNALSREEAMRLLSELADAQERLDRLQTGLHRLLEEDGP